MSDSTLLALLTFANERDAPVVDEQPLVDVHSWLLLRGSAGAVHLLIRREGSVVRSTSEIRGLDAPAAALTTASGRRYRLCGPPERTLEGQAMLFANAARIGLGQIVDESEALWSQIQSARSGN